LTRWTYCGGGVWEREGGVLRAFWDALTDHELLHPGYTPPTPEPLPWGAIVRDANGHTPSRIGNFPQPWVFPDLSRGDWSDVAQPVEILFPGVPDA
jgi:hypothetical protein